MRQTADIELHPPRKFKKSKTANNEEKISRHKFNTPSSAYELSENTWQQATFHHSDELGTRDEASA